MDMGKEMIKKKSRKLLLGAFKLFGISEHNRIPNNRIVSR
jgi:hypothetical protein